MASSSGYVNMIYTDLSTEAIRRLLHDDEVSNARKLELYEILKQRRETLTLPK